MRKIIQIKDSAITGNEIKWNLIIDGRKETLNIFLSDEIVKYATPERCDAVVMGLLIFSIRNGFDIISDIPISADLIYNLKFHLIDSICGDAIEKPTITAPVAMNVEKIGKMVLTGVSCGVDSIYTVATHLKTCSEDHNLTHLAYFDAGAHYTDIKKHEDLCEGRKRNCLSFAHEIGLQMIEIDSDLPQLIARNSDGYSHVENHTFMSVFCMLSIQKGFKYYYYSSGLSYRNFNCKYSPTGNFDSAHYDLLTLSMASFGGHKFYSTGGNTTRINKTIAISTFPGAWNHLNVCVNTVENDSICFKCRRTLLSLDVSGNLDEFKNVFNVELYRKNRKKYIQDMYIASLKGDGMMQEIMPFFNKDISMHLKISALLKKAYSVLVNRLKGR